ncbi:MAG: LbtU family siderophore porin [Gammaproteobacteria bacterium]
MSHNKILTLAVAFCLLESGNALGAYQASNSNLEDAVKSLAAQTQSLEKEVSTLKSELRHAQANPSKTVIVKQQQPVATTSTTSTPGTVNTSTLVPYVKGSILTPEQESIQEQEEDINYLIGSTVLSSPILNIHSAYDASDLIVNQSSMNEDLRFLMQRETLRKVIGDRALIPSSYRPRVFLSGKVEGQFNYMDLFGGPYQNSIDLSSVELDVLAEAGPWAYGFMSINFDGSSLSNPATVGSGNPINNSRLFLKRGFVTIGNLQHSPVYFSIGQMYVPFGTYSSYMLDNPVTLSAGRIDARAALLGFYHDGLYLSTYALNGAVNTEEGFSANHVYEWGYNAGYKWASQTGRVKTDIGFGGINNIAEAQGYQLNGLGNPYFRGFAQSTITENLEHPVGGFDTHASATLGPWTLIGEYLQATRSFAEGDLAFNDHGAKPQALHLEVDYTFNTFFDKQMALFMAGDHTWQALALNLPETSAIAGLSTSLWKNTIETIEYRRDWNYSDSDSAGGICVDPNDSSQTTFCPVPVFGAVQNSVIAQIGVYF